jgi:hypothetical protein
MRSQKTNVQSLLSDALTNDQVPEYGTLCEALQNDPLTCGSLDSLQEFYLYSVPLLVT